MVVVLIATIGAVIVSASDDAANENNILGRSFCGRHKMQRPALFSSELTDEQIEEIKSLTSDLKKEDATQEEINEEVKVLLEEYGVDIPTQDEMLDAKIEHAEQRLEILERIKELRQEQPDLSMEEIRDIIQDEFDLEETFGQGHSMRFHHGFGRGFRGKMMSCGEPEI